MVVDTLQKWTDDQTPSKVSILEMVFGGKGPTTKTRYIQTEHLTVEHAGIKLEVRFRDESGITLQYHSAEGPMSSHVALVPRSFQMCDLISKENMR